MVDIKFSDNKILLSKSLHRLYLKTHRDVCWCLYSKSI